MDGSRFWPVIAGLTLTLMAARPDCAPGQSAFSPYETAPAAGSVCKVYQLRSYFESDELCKWTADTIPSVIRPQSWTTRPKYYPELALLAVCQTPEVHAKIEEFLKSVQAAARTNKKPGREKVARMPARPENIVPARYTAPPAASQNEPAGQGGYLIPAQAQQPKHLFHFIMRFEGSGIESAITDLTKKMTGDETVKSDTSKAPMNQLLHFIIRYEGEGIIDSNVVEFMKVYLKAMKEEATKGDPLIGEVVGGASGASAGAIPPANPANSPSYNSPFSPLSPIANPSTQPLFQNPALQVSPGLREKAPGNGQPLQSPQLPPPAVEDNGPIPAGPGTVSESRKMPQVR